MACGDYVPCPVCGKSMIYGNPVCGECISKIQALESNFQVNFVPPLGSKEPGWLKKSIESAKESRKNRPDWAKSTNQSDDDLLKEFFESEEPIQHPPLVPTTLNDAFEDVLDTIGGRPKVPAPPYKETVQIKLPPKIQRQTLVVNIFAGPGAGKSTMAYGLMYDLKNRGIEAEFADEYAKLLVYEKRNYTFEDQVYLFAKQHHRIFNLLGQTDIVVTDCPLLLSPVYDGHKRPELERLVIREHRKMWNYNIFVKRFKNYNPNGRIHNEAQAKEIDNKVLDVLGRTGECYEVFDGNPQGKDKALRQILRLWDWHTKANKPV